MFTSLEPRNCKFFFPDQVLDQQKSELGLCSLGPHSVGFTDFTFALVKGYHMIKPHKTIFTYNLRVFLRKVHFGGLINVKNECYFLVCGFDF